MTDESKTKTVRNAVLGVVVVVLLGLVGCLERNDSANMADEPDPSDVIDIVVPKESLAIPEQLRKVLESVDAESIVFIDREKRLIPYTAKGEPRDLCVPSTSSDYDSRTCKHEITSGELTGILAGASSDCGGCVVGGLSRSCSKSTQKRNCQTKLYSCGAASCVSN